MKSDREFLDGIYAKVEKITSSISDKNLELNEYNTKKTQKNHVSYIRYVKYAGVAAGFLLLISSTLYANSYVKRNKQIANQPEPGKTRMMSYTDYLIGNATDILAVKASHENSDMALSVIKIYRSSEPKANVFHYLSNDVVGLSVDQSAIVFINADSRDTPIMDVFVWEPDSNRYVNPYGEIVTEEIINNSK